MSIGLERWVTKWWLKVTERDERYADEKKKKTRNKWLK